MKNEAGVSRYAEGKQSRAPVVDVGVLNLWLPDASGLGTQSSCRARQPAVFAWRAVLPQLTAALQCAPGKRHPISVVPTHQGVIHIFHGFYRGMRLLVTGQRTDRLRRSQGQPQLRDVLRPV